MGIYKIKNKTLNFYVIQKQKEEDKNIIQVKEKQPGAE